MTRVKIILFEQRSETHPDSAEQSHTALRKHRFNISCKKSNNIKYIENMFNITSGQKDTRTK